MALSLRSTAHCAVLRTVQRLYCAVAAGEPKRGVNCLYQPGVHQVPLPAAAGVSESNGHISEAQATQILREHADDREWSKSDIASAVEQHALYTWGASTPMNKAAINIVRGEGVYFYDADDRKYLDFNSQAMCLSLGHTPPQAIIDAITSQLKTLPFAYNGVSSAPIRGKLCKLLADVIPGDINTFMFPSSGAEANEAALRMARLMTGRSKIFARYRSYHGGTNATLAVTGDQRRWGAEPMKMPGVVHFFDPYPYSFSFGEDDEAITKNNLAQLHEQLKYEGPHTVAAIIVESITGTNGIVRPPKGYLEGLRFLCDKYGILLICDEVMAGWGRSGRLFGFSHSSIIPDIITFAKGVNSAYIPLGGVGVRDHVADYFRKNPVMYGSTYNGHPVALASAYATIKYMIEKRIIQHAAAMESHMQAGLQMLIDRHPSVKQGRVVGLFGGFDLCKNKEGEFIAEVTDPPTPALSKFKNALYENGLFTMVRGHQVFCIPPLVITPNQIREGFAIIDKCLPIMDEAMEG